ncbi:MAG: NIPSNAP family protein [Bryobacteraceae bacterium]
MDRRELLTGLAASALGASVAQSATVSSSVYLELKTWHLHTTHENQGKRVADYLEHGLEPALHRAGAGLIGAFGNVIGEEGPYYVTLAQYDSLAKMQSVLQALEHDSAYQSAVEKLSAGPGLPFVRVESSLLRSFGPRGGAHRAKGESSHIFEMRTYESQSFTSVKRKIWMFEHGEIDIFEKLGMKPVFFGERIVGPKMPCITYMLTFDSLGDREKLWHEFGSSAAWKKLSSNPELKDAEIVANISNAILRPLKFSQIR